jgi:hypothetical protein
MNQKYLWHVVGIITALFGSLPIFIAIFLFFQYLDTSLLDVELSLGIWLILSSIAFSLLFIIRKLLIQTKKDVDLTILSIKLTVFLGYMSMMSAILCVIMYLVGPNKISGIFWSISPLISQILTWLLVDILGQQCILLQPLFGFVTILHLFFSILFFSFSFKVFTMEVKNNNHAGVLLVSLGGLLFFGAILWLAMYLLSPIFMNEPGITIC